MSAWLRNFLLLQTIPRSPNRIGSKDVVKKLEEKGFHVSLRTVQRDLNALAEMIPELESDGNKDMIGWYWRADAPLLNLPSYDPSLALAFRLSEEYLRPQLPEAVLSPLEPYFRHADKVLNESENTGYLEWPKKVRFVPKGQPLKAPEIDEDIFKTIQSALFEGRKLKGLYQPVGRDVREYELNPLALVYRGNVIYMVATTWDFDDFKQFAIHRFSKVWALVEPAREIDGFDLDSYIADGNFDWSYGSDIKLVAHFHEVAARILEETPLSDDQTIEPFEDEPEWFEVSATVKNTEQLRWWLMEWGDNVEVVEPAVVRHWFTELAENLYDYYV